MDPRYWLDGSDESNISRTLSEPKDNHSFFMILGIRSMRQAAKRFIFIEIFSWVINWKRVRAGEIWVLVYIRDGGEPGGVDMEY